VFIGSPLERGSDKKMADMTQNYTTQNLLIENNEMKRKIQNLENEKNELK
jgi:hypothetical protein